MNNEERQIFWETLCSLDGANPEEDCNRIRTAIQFPKFIYRYRAVKESSIDALNRNRLYFSTANYYDDPFDTFIKIDYNEIRRQVQEVLLPSNISLFMNALSARLGITAEERTAIEVYLNGLPVSESVENIVNYLKSQVQSILKETMWSCCFSEDGNNEVMWMKYADQYNGFCLIYDLKADENWYCGKQEKCKDCVVNKSGVSLFPVYYSDEGYNATQLAKDIVVDQVLSFIPMEMAKKLSAGPTVKPWERERVTLIKSECHKYDKEWRLLLRGPAQGPIMMEWVPYGVILGLRMSAQNREMIIQSAKNAGIQHIFESYINDNSRLDIRELAIC